MNETIQLADYERWTHAIPKGRERGVRLPQEIDLILLHSFFRSEKNIFTAADKN